jgi:hypothetical protein
MAEESDSIKTASGLIPGVYYDLIARVSAGIPILALLLWEPGERHFPTLEFGEAINAVLLLGGGYITGLLLTPLSLVTAWVNPGLSRLTLAACSFRRTPRNSESWLDKRLDGICLPLEKMHALDETINLPGAKWFRNDIIASVDKDAGILIGKMRAEMMLCMNLFAGYLFITLVHWRWPQVAPIVNYTESWRIAGGLLGLATIHRQVMYLGRQCALYNMYASHRLLTEVH